MSIEHVASFVSALKANVNMQTEIKRQEGGNGGLDALVDNGHLGGYP
ncbi:MAG: hypothetical protein AB7N91_27660 [Candidatus Tectimicrobiota bacterium]